MVHKGMIVWFTGLSGAGKTTLCDAVHPALLYHGFRTEIVDADEVRKYLSMDLGFSHADREENVRRIAALADTMAYAGSIVLVACIAPYRKLRAEVRWRLHRPPYQSFIEVYVNAPFSVCEERDPKGLYKKARAGAVQNFTGLSDPYEPPLHPEVECHTDKETLQQSTARVVEFIRQIYVEKKYPVELGGVDESTAAAAAASPSSSRRD